jgi:outer membrane protein assembly factor BamA
MKLLLVFASLLMAAHGVAQEAEIKVRSMTLRGNTVLTSTAEHRLSSEIKRHRYKTYAEISQRVLLAYQDRGYFKAIVEDAIPIKTSPKRSGEGVDVLVRVKEGKQYRLQDIVIKGITAFPPAIVRNQLRINPGDVFNRTLVGRSLENIRKLYDSAGYVNCTMVPETDLQEDSGLITLIIDVEQGKRFHWGKLIVNGDESIPGAKEKLMSTWSKHEGTVFDSDKTLSTFLRELKARPEVRPDDIFSPKFDQQSGLVHVEVTLSSPPAF